jgi:hypothetical protein
MMGSAMLGSTPTTDRNGGEPALSLTKRLTDYSDPGSFGSRLRRRRIQWLVGLVRAAHEKRGAVSVLDLGGTAAYWRAFPTDTLEQCNVSITLLNLPEPDVHPVPLPPRFRAVDGDACRLVDYEDQSVDIVHSNSVLEHVGGWAQMEAFAKEVRRVGRAYFVQTPNFWFPMEPHFMMPGFHWLPKPARVWLVQQAAFGHRRRQESVAAAVRIVESVDLIDRSMFRSLFPDADHVTERFFMLPKSLMAIKKAV